MDRLRIKEHVIGVLKEKLPNKHTITGEYPENLDTTAIVVSIIQEKPVLGRGTGRLSYDFIADVERTLYVTILTIGIRVLAAIDEEASSIAGGIQDVLRSIPLHFTSKELGIKSMTDVSGITPPTMVEPGKRKTWAVNLNFNLIITEIIETQRG